MKLIAVCIGDAETIPGKTSGKSGINKRPVDYPVLIDGEGLSGDRILNRKYHGGPDQAVYLEGGIDRDWWRQELGAELEPGAFGENLLVEGLANRDIAVGDRFIIGEVVLEVTSARTPCATFAAHMRDKMFVKRFAQAARPGAYARVIAGGIVRAGDDVEHRLYDGERIGMAELMENHGKRLSAQERERMLTLPISARLRAMIA